MLRLIPFEGESDNVCRASTRMRARARERIFHERMTGSGLQMPLRFLGFPSIRRRQTDRQALQLVLGHVLRFADKARRAAARGCSLTRGTDGPPQPRVEH